VLKAATSSSILFFLAYLFGNPAVVFLIAFPLREGLAGVGLSPSSSEGLCEEGGVMFSSSNASKSSSTLSSLPKASSPFLALPLFVDVSFRDFLKRFLAVFLRVLGSSCPYEKSSSSLCLLSIFA